MGLFFDRSRPRDAVVIGRAGMDLYPIPDGTRIAEATELRTDLGGSAGNIAVALARLGKRAALLSPLSDDPVGQFVRRRLADAGVDTGLCRTLAGDPRTSLALAETRTDDGAVVIYRNNAADLHLDMADVGAAALSESACMIVTGTTLARNPARRAVMAALAAARAAGTRTILDMDYRQYSWASAAEAQAAYRDAAALSDAVIGNDTEFAVLAGSPAEARGAAAALIGGDTELVIFKRGGAGSTTFTRTGSFDTGVFPVAVKKPFGAGDAFMGALLAALLDGAEPAGAVRRGSAAAAIVVSRPGCASAMPDSAELDRFLARHDASGATGPQDHRPSGD